MASIKVAEATGIVLDWLVARCEGYTNLRRNVHRFNNDWLVDSPHNQYGPMRLTALGYSTDPAMAWPIIEREIDCLRKRSKAEEAALAHPNPNFKFKAEIFADVSGYYCGFGPTPLIAAMRCYVASKLGDEVEALLKG